MNLPFPALEDRVVVIELDGWMDEDYKLQFKSSMNSLFIERIYPVVYINAMQSTHAVFE